MFKPIEEVTTTKFVTDHKWFIVDIEESKTHFTAWLYHERYQVKYFLRRTPKSKTNFRDFSENLESLVNIAVWEYYDYYQSDKLGYDYDDDAFYDFITTSDYQHCDSSDIDDA